MIRAAMVSLVEQSKKLYSGGKIKRPPQSPIQNLPRAPEKSNIQVYVQKGHPLGEVPESPPSTNSRRRLMFYSYSSATRKHR